MRGKPYEAPTAQPTAPVSTTASAFNSAVWAKIPYCGCRNGSPTDGVSNALKEAQLAGTVKILNPSKGWLYFEVAYDPEMASSEQIDAAIVAGGGEVMAGPP